MRRDRLVVPTVPGVLAGVVLTLWVASIAAAQAEPAAPARVAEVPAYYVIPIIGAVEENAIEAFTTGINAARRAKATHIVLVLDSPGGTWGSFKPILDAIIATNDMQWIAVVQQANCQVAALALACPEVLITPEARIGGMGVAEVPRGREAPPVIAAALRTAAQHTGRDELLARGLVEPDLGLAVEEDASGQVQIVQITDAKQLRGRRGLKKRGDLLVLSSEEALRLGLATGTIDALPATKPGAATTESLRPVAEALGVDRWRAAGSAAGAMERVTESEARRKYMKEHEDDLGRLDGKIRELEQEEAKIRTALATGENAKSEVRGATARRRMDNAAAKRQVRLAEVRRQLQQARDRRRKILQAAPRE